MTLRAISTDLLIYALGYETRSFFAAEHVSAVTKIALAFPSSNACAYEKNLSSAQKANHVILEMKQITAQELLERIRLALSGLESTRDDDRLVVALDVSSMTREFMAKVIFCLRDLALDCRLLLKVLYSPALYRAPPFHSGTYTNFQPVGGLEGWTLYPERPLTVILGLGYEQDQAVGVVEYFDPSGTWAFRPHGPDPKFLTDVNAANASLEPFVDSSNWLDYQVVNPDLLFSELRGLADVLSKRSRVVMVPAGPKIFSALSILACLEIGKEVSVWRASTHSSAEALDAKPEGRIVEFDYTFRSMQD